MAQYDINLRDYWRILKKRKAIVIVTALILGFFSTAFAIFRAPTPLFTSACNIKFERDTAVEGLYSKTMSWPGEEDLETQISVIRSYAVMERVAKRLGLIPQDVDSGGDQVDPRIVGLVQSLQGKVRVGRDGFTNIISISVTDTNGAFAQRLANGVAVTYKEFHAEQQARRTTEALRYITDQLKHERQKLQEAEEEFNSFSQRHQLISIDMQSEKLLVRSQEFQTQIRQLREDRRELEGLLERAEEFTKNPSRPDADFYSAIAGNQYQGTNNSLVEFLLKRETLLKDYTEKHPEVIAVRRKIVEIAKKMALILKLQVRDLGNKEAGLRNDQAKVDVKTTSLMDKKLEYDRLKRKVKMHNDMTVLLEQKNQEALIRQAEKPEEVTIVKPAHLPTFPINPPKTATTGAMGVVVGLVLGMVTAFIMETFDTSLGAIEDVEETIGSQVLGVVPQVDSRDLQDALGETYPEGLKANEFEKTVHMVSHFAPKSMIAESFRALRTNIQFKDTEKKTRTISVTSASPQEGKTLVSINLAIAMAQAGTRTLLIASDMRKPKVSRIFGVEMTPGLTDILMGNHPWRNTVKTVTDIIMGKMGLDQVMMTPGLDNLYLVTSGAIPPNPAELIESKRMAEFIEQAKEEYDLIIFDTPPILSTADAAIMGAKMDGVLIVYRVGSVSKGLLKRSTTQLEQVKSNIMGVILNGMKPEVSPDFQDFKYYKYYYSYGEETERSPGLKNKLFSFLPGMGSKKEEAWADLPPEQADKQLKDDQKKKLTLPRIFLIVLAMAFLGAGVYFENAGIDFYKLIGMTDKNVEEAVAKPIVKSRIQSPRIEAEADMSEAPVKSEPDPKTASLDSGEAIKEPEKTIERIDPSDTEDPPVESAIETKAYPYSLYLGSFRTRERVQKVVSNYTQKGLSPYWTKVVFKDKGEWYRVFVGHFQNEEQAAAFAEEHKVESPEVLKTRFANLIGAYANKQELGEQISSLDKLGYSPYVIDDIDGKSRLLVGAYVTEKGAVEQYKQLKSNGIDSQVVER